MTERVAGKFVAGVVLLCAALLLMPYSRDYGNYLSLCQARAASDFFSAISYYDPVFSLLCHLSGRLGIGLEFALTALVIVGLSLYLKLQVFSRFRDAFWFIVAFYVARFFLLQDVTQLRAGLAAALIGAVFVATLERRKLLPIVYSGAAVLVHLSSVAVLPFVIMVALLRRQAALLLATVFSGVALTLYVAGIVFPQVGGLGLELVQLVPVSDFRLKYYLEDSPPVSVPVYANVYLGLKAIASLIFFGALISGKRFLDERIYAVGVLFSTSLLVAIFFYHNEVLSLRFSELLSVFDAVFVGVLVASLAKGTAAPLMWYCFWGSSVALLFRQLHILL